MNALLLPAFTVLLAGCSFFVGENSNHGDDSELEVTVRNGTSQEVILAYSRCSRSSGETKDMSVLPSGEKAVINVCEPIVGEETVEVTFGGRTREYAVEPDFWGHDKITIREEDFGT